MAAYVDNTSTSISREISAIVVSYCQTPEHVFGIYMVDVCGGQSNDLNIPISVERHSSSAVQLRDHDMKWERCFLLFVPHGHILLYQQPKVDTTSVHDSVNERRLREVQEPSFWDGMMVLLIKPNHNLATMFKSLFSIGATTPVHLSVS